MSKVLEILFVLLLIFLPGVIYLILKKSYWKSITKQSELDFYIIKNVKIYLSKSNYNQLLTILFPDKYNKLGFLGGAVIVGRNEYGNIPDEDTKHKYSIIRKYLNNEFKKSKEAFLKKYYYFDFIGNDAIYYSNDILFYYLKYNKMGDLFRIFDDDFSEHPYLIRIETKSIKLSIIVKEINRIKGNIDDFEVLCNNHKYKFEKKKIEMAPNI